jgi:L-fucose isomerase-like protein
MAAQRIMTFGVVVGNRGFFPDHLAKTGREEIISVLEAVGARVVVLSPEESKHGAVETYTESQRCAELFKKHADEIDGIIVTLPNFGEERGIVDAIRLSGLKVPVLVQATPDRSEAMTIATRRDSFCGKMSACNNMMQYGIAYSLTTLHTESLASAEFKADLEWFSAVCRIVKGLKNLRIGAIGARPTAFNTVRYSERILETSGITIETIDLSEIFGRINKMKDNRRRCAGQAGRHQEIRDHRRHSRCGADEDGQAGRGDRRLDEASPRHHQRGAVLDLDGGILRRGALHHHEHDERQPDSRRRAKRMCRAR